MVVLRPHGPPHSAEWVLQMDRLVSSAGEYWSWMKAAGDANAHAGVLLVLELNLRKDI